MNSGATADPLPQHLRSTYDLVKSAFPGKIDREEYLPLLSLLGEQMSDRNLAEVVSHAFAMGYEEVLNDIYHARSTNAPSREAVEKAKERLLPHGFQNWLQKE